MSILNTVITTPAQGQELYAFIRAECLKIDTEIRQHCAKNSIDYGTTCYTANWASLAKNPKNATPYMLYRYSPILNIAENGLGHPLGKWASILNDERVSLARTLSFSECSLDLRAFFTPSHIADSLSPFQYKLPAPIRIDAEGIAHYTPAECKQYVSGLVNHLRLEAQKALPQLKVVLKEAGYLPALVLACTAGISAWAVSRISKLNTQA